MKLGQRSNVVPFVAERSINRSRVTLCEPMYSAELESGRVDVLARVTVRPEHYPRFGFAILRSHELSAQGYEAEGGIFVLDDTAYGRFRQGIAPADIHAAMPHNASKHARPDTMALHLLPSYMMYNVSASGLGGVFNMYVSENMEGNVTIANSSRDRDVDVRANWSSAFATQESVDRSGYPEAAVIYYDFSQQA